MKKNVLILTTFYKPFTGGAEVFVEEITKRLDDNFNFFIFTARHSSSLLKREIVRNTTIYRLGLGFKYDKFLFPLLALIKSYSIDFDLAYAIMASYAGAGALLIKFIRRKEYVLSMQSGTLDTKSYFKILKLFWFFYKKIHTEALFIHVISNYLKERAIKFNVPINKIFRIPNGIDVNKFKILDINRNYWQIVAVANLKKVKGLEYLLRAMPTIISKFPQAKLLLVGDGEERVFLESLADNLEIKNHVQFLGAMNHDKVPYILNSSNVFIGPSLAEGLGIVFLEAMACGAVVIGTKVGGICDTVEDHYNGLLIEPANHMVIANRILYLLENKTILESLRSNALKLVKAYDWDNISSSVKLLLEKNE